MERKIRVMFRKLGRVDRSDILRKRGLVQGIYVKGVNVPEKILHVD